MRLSIIIPSYQQGRYIGRTLASIVEQEGDFEREIFVVDGGSTDETRDVIRKYEKEITWWRSHKDDGQTAAINEGLSHATGDVVAYINSDDYYLPGAFRAVNEWAKLESDDKLWLAGGCLAIEETTKSNTYVRATRPPQDLVAMFGQPWCPPQPSCFWRKELFQELGRLDASLHYIMDVEWNVRCVAGGFAPHISSEIMSVRWLHDEAKSAEKARFFTEMALVAGRSPYLSPAQRQRAVALLKNRERASGHSKFVRRAQWLIRDALAYPPIIKTWVARLSNIGHD